MKKLLLFGLVCAVSFAQVKSNGFRAIPSGSNRGYVEFETPAGRLFRLVAPLSMASNVSLTMPDQIGTAGQCLKRVGVDSMEWGDCATVAPPLILTSDLYPQIQVLGATDSNKQMLLGYDVTANQTMFQSVHQGVAFTPITLQPFGGAVSVGLPGASGTQLNVTGDTWTKRLCNRGQDDYAPGFCWKFQGDTGVYSLNEQASNSGVFETSISGNSVTFYRSLLPLSIGGSNIGSNDVPWGSVNSISSRVRSSATNTKFVDYSFGSVNSIEGGIVTVGGASALHLAPTVGHSVTIRGLGTGTTSTALFSNGSVKSRGVQLLGNFGTMADNTGFFVNADSTSQLSIRKDTDAGAELMRFETSGGLPSIARIGGDLSPFSGSGTLGTSTAWSSLRVSSILAPAGGGSLGDTFAPWNTVNVSNLNSAISTFSGLTTFNSSVSFGANGIYLIGSSSNRAGRVWTRGVDTEAGFTSTFNGRVNFRDGVNAPNGSDGLNATINVRRADNSGSCTITVSGGLITGTTCP